MRRLAKTLLLVSRLANEATSQDLPDSFKVFMKCVLLYFAHVAISASPSCLHAVFNYLDINLNYMPPLMHIAAMTSASLF